MSVGIFERIRVWFYAHLITPLHEMTWKERILLVFFGFWFGIFPIPGLSTTLLLLAFAGINRHVEKRLTISETTVATAVNILSTPFCIALMPFWMRLGSFIFQLESKCKASQIIDQLYGTCRFLGFHLSDEFGFFAALSKFAGCLGAATASWILATVVVLPAILIARARIQSMRPLQSDRLYGEFSVLGEGNEGGEISTEQESSNGRKLNFPSTHYHRLVEPGELRPVQTGFPKVGR
jgi:hypothetical protein